MQDTLYLKKINKIPQGCNIAIFGGSFNPPHAGHLYLAEHALKINKFDLVIWLVSPQNPLKTKNAYSLEERMQMSWQMVKRNKRILVMDIEKSFGSNFTYNSLHSLQKILPKQTKITWIMGEDILNVLHLFKNWRKILEEFTIKVYSRSDKPFKSLSSKPASLIQRINGSYFFQPIKWQNVSSTKQRELNDRS